MLRKGEPFRSNGGSIDIASAYPVMAGFKQSNAMALFLASNAIYGKIANSAMYGKESGMEVTMKVSVLTSRLKARLSVLKRRREKALKNHDSAFKAWKMSLALWLRSDAAKDAVAKLTKQDIGDTHYVRGVEGIPAYALLRTAPRPPKKPEDTQIREIQRFLRYLKVTSNGRGFVTPSRSQVDAWFRDKEDDS